MIELSLHILDVVQNSIVAGAKTIHITVVDDPINDFLSIEILDDGKGMEPNILEMAADPFYTSRTTRKVGLGLPLFKQAAEQCNGCFSIQSEICVGTRVLATFVNSHIDRQPLGDIAGVLSILSSGNPDIDFIYSHTTNSGNFEFNTKEVKQILEGMPINDSKVTMFLREMIQENLKNINASI